MLVAYYRRFKPVCGHIFEKGVVVVVW